MKLSVAILVLCLVGGIEVSGENPGPSGPIPGPMPGLIPGPMPGPISGPISGPIPGQISGSTPGPIPGPKPGPSGPLIGDSWEILPSGEVSGEVPAGPSGEASGEVTAGPSGEASGEVTPEPTGAPSIPARRIYKNGKTSGSVSDEASSGQNSEESEDSCVDPAFYTLLGFFRGFPKTDSKEINGYEAALYDPLLDAFWAKKDDIGLETALNGFMMEFSKAVMAEHYQCKGTQLNQILIDVLKKTTTTFMSKAETYIISTLEKIKKPGPTAASALSRRGRHHPWRRDTVDEINAASAVSRRGRHHRRNTVDEINAASAVSRRGRHHRRRNTVDEINAASAVSRRGRHHRHHERRDIKRGKNMKNFKSKVEQIVAKTSELLKKVLSEDVASHMETEQFEEIACYLRFVREHLRSAVEAKVTLVKIKQELKESSVEDFSDVFQCTDPMLIVQIYEKNWQSANLPEEENILFQHIGEALMRVLAKSSEDRQWMEKVLDNDNTIQLNKIIHMLAMKVLTNLQPFLDAKSTDEMIEFFKKFLTSKKMEYAEKLIRSLDIFDVADPMSSPESMKSPAPVRRNNLMESELDNIMNELIERYV